MRTGRPVKEETQYKIIIYTNGGRRYASTKIAIVGEDGKKQYRHRHWGSLDKNNRFHPNTTYFNASPSEMKKLIFDQVEICKVFGFEIPDGCAPSYTSKAKSKTPKRGRLPKPKTEVQEF